ncbi:MAG: hypothetical protein ACI8WY_003407 [Planctomycetota bacterium]|jgi:hypothetical protein
MIRLCRPREVILDPSQPARGVLLPLPRTETQQGFPLWDSCAQGSTVESVGVGGQHGWTILSECETVMEAENFVGGRPAIRGARARQSGLGLIELMIAGSVFVIGALSAVRLFASSIDVERSNQETAVATEATRRVLEQLEAHPDPAAMFALHNASPDDDPVGLVPIAGAVLGAFVVDGLQPLAGIPDGAVGSIVFPVDSGTGILREDLDLPELGMPRDLNSDGVIDSDDRSGDYQLLPVLVRVRWDAGGNAREHSVLSLLSPR